MTKSRLEMVLLTLSVLTSAGAVFRLLRVSLLSEFALLIEVPVLAEIPLLLGTPLLVGAR